MNEVGLNPLIAIHAGAGPLTVKLTEHEAEIREVLADVLGAGRQLLEEGAEAVEVVKAAVTMMEDYELFNAGRGSALCSDGSAQMSASLMRGTDRAAGSVAGVMHTKNPVLAAEAVLDSYQVLMIGEHAEEFARSRGAEQCPNDYFITERQQDNLTRRIEQSPAGTVGAVCLDRSGTLAAATSTGGITGQPPGRVGDSAVIGAGTWADTGVSVSCTGDGELFIRVAVARTISALVERGVSLCEAVDRALAEVAELGGTGGVIACAADGSVVLPFTTEAMPRGAWRAGGEPEVWVTEPDGR
jgi:isoaspartyl peptidase/L-asparaginase-like protein (Ntn-hydrolase superfamily)